jgi:hypothetical protein
MLGRWTWAAAASLLALGASAAPRQGNTYDELDATTATLNGDGTLWFQSLGGSSSGGAQLAAVRIWSPGAYNGAHWALLKWNKAHLLYCEGQDLTGEAGAGGPASTHVLDPAAMEIANCRGVATFNGGFVVTDDTAADDPDDEPPADGNVSDVRPRGGALFWTNGQLFALEVTNNNAVQTAFVRNGAFQGVAVLTSKIYDTNAAGGVVASRIAATALAYTNGHVYLVELDLQDGAIAVTANYEVFDPAGNPITNLRGITVTNSGFNTAAVPHRAEGVAVLWNNQNVWVFEHRISTGDAITAVLDPAGAPIADCWGVMPVLSRHIAATISGTVTTVYDIFTEQENYLAKFTTTSELYLNANPIESFATEVVIGNPLLKRQASFLYEIQGKSSNQEDPNQRGMIIGLNQRAP